MFCQPIWRYAADVSYRILMQSGGFDIRLLLKWVRLVYNGTIRIVCDTHILQLNTLNKYLSLISYTAGLHQFMADSGYPSKAVYLHQYSVNYGGRISSNRSTEPLCLIAVYILRTNLWNPYECQQQKVVD